VPVAANGYVYVASYKQISIFGVQPEKKEGLPALGIPFPGAAAAPPPKGSYEAHVMQGIWAAAPYLNNGSVPTLAELLKPADQRVTASKVGPAYDTVSVGLAAQQTQFNYTLTTTDCGNLNSGNSRAATNSGRS
jgi:hypothetical protein